MVGRRSRRRAASRGGFVVGYRVRHGHDGLDENVIATSDARGETLTEVVRLPASHFGARWIERPAIVPLADGGSAGSDRLPRR